MSCSFGLKLVFKQKSNALRFMKFIGLGHLQWDLLLLQPVDVDQALSAKQIRAEWRQMDDGILCRFKPLNEWHEFAVIPLVTVHRFDLELFNKSGSTTAGVGAGDGMRGVDEDDAEWLEEDERAYYQQYMEQYMDYYGMRDNEDDEEDLDLQHEDGMKRERKGKREGKRRLSRCSVEREMKRKRRRLSGMTLGAVRG